MTEMTYSEVENKIKDLETQYNSKVAEFMSFDETLRALEKSVVKVAGQVPADLDALCAAVKSVQDQKNSMYEHMNELLNLLHKLYTSKVNYLSGVVSAQNSRLKEFNDDLAQKKVSETLVTEDRHDNL